MPRARLQPDYDRQVAAADDQDGRGCFSRYLLPPLAVILVGGLLAAFALRDNVYAGAVLLAPAAPPAASESSWAASAVAQSTEPRLIMTIVATGRPPIRPEALLAAGLSGLHGRSSSPALSAVFRPEIQHWAQAIVRWAAAAGIDPNLAAVVMQIESCGDPRARSRSGAMGLFQVMPFHFSPIEDPYDPDTNAVRGLEYLARSFAAGGGDPRLALAGYNGGIGMIQRGESTWSDQTRRYVDYGAPIYFDASAGLTASPTLEEWHSHFGTMLCRQAAERLGIP